MAHLTPIGSRFAISLQAQLQNIRTWMFLMVVLFLTRFIWLWTQRDELPVAVTAVEWVRFFHFGFRIDCVTLTILLLPCIVCAAMLAVIPKSDFLFRWVHLGTVIATCILAPILAFANATYYQAWGDVINVFVFDFFEGNATAIAVGAVTDFGLIPKLCISLIFTSCCLILYFRYLRHPVELPQRLNSLSQRRLGQLAISTVLALMVVIGYRGTFGPVRTREIQSSISEHRVLNLGTLNAFYNLKSAIRAYRQKLRYFEQGKPLEDEEILVAVRRIAPYTNLAMNGTNTDEQKICSTSCDLNPQGVWARHAAGPPNEPPSHVFVLFLESYDSWPFLEPYKDLKLVEHGKAIGREGHLLLNHLPAGNTSMDSGLACVQGIFDTYAGRQQVLPTSMVHAFKSLGYCTRNVNGFPLKWGDTGRIAKEQGFDEVYCTENFLPGGETSDNQLHDETLFKLAAEKLSYDKPTFSFIRSSSYHVPFEVDLAKADCEVGPYPESIQKLPGLHNETNMRKVLGHLKYTDKQAGMFIRTMSRRFPDALFVITGDHYGRHHPTVSPSVYEASSVPLIFYGPEVLKGTSLPENMAASHIDLVTTLIELCAPKGFQYTSMGKNIFAKCDQPRGVGTNYVLFPDCIVDLRMPRRVEPLPWTTISSWKQNEIDARIDEAVQLHDSYHRLGFNIALNFHKKETSQGSASTMR